MHITPLGQLHLNDMGSLLGVAIVTGSPAAFETAIGDTSIGLSRIANGLYSQFNPGITAGPIIGANIEVWQVAFK